LLLWTPESFAEHVFLLHTFYGKIIKVGAIFLILISKYGFGIITMQICHTCCDKRTDIIIKIYGENKYMLLTKTSTYAMLTKIWRLPTFKTFSITNIPTYPKLEIS